MVLTATYDTDIPFGMEVPQGHRNEFIQRDKSDHPFFQDGRQSTMLNVQTCHLPANHDTDIPFGVGVP